MRALAQRNGPIVPLCRQTPLCDLMHHRQQRATGTLAAERVDALPLHR